MGKMGILDEYSSSSLAEFLVENFDGRGWPSLLVALIIISSSLLLAWEWKTKRRLRSLHTSKLNFSVSQNRQIWISEIISNSDFRNLIDSLDGKLSQTEKWENVIDKRNSLLSYNAKCSKPKDGPLKYLSVTVFENCSTETLRNFYLDNDYRKQWDKTLVEHEQLYVDQSNGTEIGRTIKKFPLLTPREYILAWRLWEGADKTFYCFIKECEHHLAPQQKKYVRVGFFRSGWRIRKVPGRNACEIEMVHQEDAGLNVEMAKFAFAKGIWNYVCKMDNALRKYSTIHRSQTGSAPTAITLIQKVPQGFDMLNSMICSAHAATSASSDIRGRPPSEAKGSKFMKRPSKKLVTNGLLLLGGAICLSRGHSRLGAKVAMAYILKKLSNRNASSGQSKHS